MLVEEQGMETGGGGGGRKKNYLAGIKREYCVSAFSICISARRYFVTFFFLL